MPSAPSPGRPSRGSEHRLIAFAAFVLVGMGVLVALVWALRSLLLLTFLAIVLSVLLGAGGDFLHRWTRLPRSLAVLLSTALTLAIVGGAIAIMMPVLRGQIAELVTQVPAAVDALQDRIGQTPWLRDAWENLRSQFSLPAPSAAVWQLGALLGYLSSWLSNLILILFAALFLALSPADYVDGTVRLVPVRQRDFARGLLAELARTLRAWAGGQLLMMALVGILVGLGLWLLGLRNALALGLFAAITEFVPYLGPILGAAPAVLIALTQSPLEALWVVLLFLLVQQIEGNILQPAIQQSAVHIPPALLLVVLFGMGQLFGLPGLIVATPLLAVVIVAVKRIYVERILEAEDEVPAPPAP